MKRLITINIILAGFLVSLLIILVINYAKICSLYIDNGLNRSIIIKISYLKTDGDSDFASDYIDEESVSVGANDRTKYRIHIGNIRVTYDSVVSKYNIDESGTWIFNPYRKNKYSYRYIVYGNSYGNSNSKNARDKGYSGELFHIDNVDYLFQSPPSSISVKKGSSTITKTSFTRD
ncbi:MAG: hypothetical protein NTV87_15920 [Ignavibacteriae bacterium]|nr:hypothetical protein [Ignavibacteriota bacterium]